VLMQNIQVSWQARTGVNTYDNFVTLYIENVKTRNQGPKPEKNVS
jgi:hypothetical protein